MTGTLLDLFHNRWRPFFLAFLVCFVPVSTAVFLIKTKHVVKSSIIVASFLIGERPEPLDPAAQTARLVTEFYRPFAATVLLERGVPVPSLVAVEDLKADAIGRNVILQSVVGESDVTLARDLQQIIIDQVIKDNADLVQIMRDGIRAKIESARRSAQDLTDQIEILKSQLDQTTSRNETSIRHLANLRDDYSQKIKRAANVEDAQQNASIEMEIRELRERIGSEEMLSRDLFSEGARISRDLFETRRFREEQLRLQNSGERELSVANDVRVARLPSVLPVPVGAQRLFLLGAAIAFSLLMAFGAIVFLQRLENDPFWRPSRPEKRPLVQPGVPDRSAGTSDRVPLEEGRLRLAERETS